VGGDQSRWARSAMKASKEGYRGAHPSTDWTFRQSYRFPSVPRGPGPAGGGAPPPPALKDRWARLCSDPTTKQRIRVLRRRKSVRRTRTKKKAHAYGPGTPVNDCGSNICRSTWGQNEGPCFATRWVVARWEGCRPRPGFGRAGPGPLPGGHERRHREGGIAGGGGVVHEAVHGA